MRRLNIHYPLLPARWTLKECATCLCWRHFCNIQCFLCSKVSQERSTLIWRSGNDSNSSSKTKKGKIPGELQYAEHPTCRCRIRKKMGAELSFFFTVSTVLRWSPLELGKRFSCKIQSWAYLVSEFLGVAKRLLDRWGYAMPACLPTKMSSTFREPYRSLCAEMHNWLTKRVIHLCEYGCTELRAQAHAPTAVHYVTDLVFRATIPGRSNHINLDLRDLDKLHHFAHILCLRAKV